LLLPSSPTPPCSTLFPYTTLFRSAGVPHPIPYQGSKRQLAHYIVSLFPAGSTRLVEPFVGSAAVSLAAGHLKRVKRWAINDLHRSEEHTSELQSRENLVCRLLLEK